MSNPFKPIAISLIPNFVLEDILRAIFLLVRPWNYLNESAEVELQEAIKKYTGKKYVVLFESGRAAQYFLLKAIGISEKDSVVLQAFTCVAVPNSIIWTGAETLYVDIDDNLNIDPQKFEKIIKANTKAVIVQHTFGKPADIKKIRTICSKHKITLIEDLAHGFGNKNLGSGSEAAFLSFGRDKTISGIWGGAIITDNYYIFENLQKEVDQLLGYKRSWVFQQLLFAPLVYFVLQTYSLFNLGKFTHKLLFKFNILPKVLDSSEKEGHKQKVFRKGMPGALAQLTMSQLKKLERFVLHRKMLAKQYAIEFGAYDDNSSYLRYTINVSDAASLRRYAAKQNIFLGDWYDSVIAPKGVKLENVGYKSGSCPVAEEATEHVVNLPTNPNLNISDVKKVVDTVKEWKKLEK